MIVDNDDRVHVICSWQQKVVWGFSGRKSTAFRTPCRGSFLMCMIMVTQDEQAERSIVVGPVSDCRVRKI